MSNFADTPEHETAMHTQALTSAALWLITHPHRLDDADIDDIELSALRLLRFVNAQRKNAA